MADTEHKQSDADAKKIVFHYLKYRPRSEREIIEKLRSKGYPNDTVERVVAYFKRIGSINDQLFAAGWMRSRLNKPLGMRRIRMELKQKGVADELIRQAAETAAQDYEERDAVVTLAQRQLAHYRGLDQGTQRRRLYNYLARRGFTSEAILKAFREIKI